MKVDCCRFSRRENWNSYFEAFSAVRLVYRNSYMCPGFVRRVVNYYRAIFVRDNQTSRQAVLLLKFYFGWPTALASDKRHKNGNQHENRPRVTHALNILDFWAGGAGGPIRTRSCGRVGMTPRSLGTTTKRVGFPQERHHVIPASPAVSFARTIPNPCFSRTSQPD